MKPKYLYRQEDNEPFVLKEDGLYYLENALIAFPNNSHHSYSYESLISRGFKSTTKPHKSLEDHIGEFYYSLYHSIEKAGGSASSITLGMTLVDLAAELAKNGIRFTYEKRF
jgi:hypothetical protein